MAIFTGSTRVRWFSGLALLALLASMAGSTLGAPRGEYEVKAAFVLNFATLVNWPSGRLGEKTPLDVVVMSNADQYTSIQGALAGKNVDGRPVRARRVDSVGQISNAHIVFATKAAGVGPSDLASATRGKNVLLIGESKDFARRGGTINFYTEQSKVRFEVNPEAAKKAGLTISSRLLSVARIVGN